MTDARPDDADLARLTALGDQLLRLQRRRTTVYEGTCLDNSAFRILWILDDGEPRTLRQLAQALDLEQSTMNRQANAAIAAGYLERFEVPGSASRRLRPTPAGKQAYDHDGRIRADLMQRALERMGADRADALIAAMREFNDAWDQALA